MLPHALDEEETEAHPLPVGADHEVEAQRAWDLLAAIAYREREARIVSAQLTLLVPDQEDIVGPPRELPVPPPPQGETAFLPEGLAEELEDGVLVSWPIVVNPPLVDGYSLPRSVRAFSSG